MIDFSSLRTLFRTMAEEEIICYYTGVEFRGRTKRLLLFQDELSTVLADRVAFKRRYYTMVHEELSRVGSSPIRPRFGTPSDSELYDLEMKLSTDYMKVYCWYYYYQSGMYLTANHTAIDLEQERAINNVYYRYVFPPLYSSLYILLDRGEPSNLVQFDPSINPALEPSPRGLDYFQKLPTFNALHIYMVLQPEDYALLFQSQGTASAPHFNEPEFQSEKSRVEKAENIIDRYGNPLEVSRRAPIEALVQKYQNYVAPGNGRLVKLGREQPIDQEAQQRNTGFDRFRLRGVATF